MKEIFDWMREQMLKRKSAWEEDSVADKVSAEKHIGTWNVALRILEKAEAKWKEDCKRADFEKRINEVLPMLEEQYLYGTVSLIKDLAYVLGIKIAEVE